MYFLLVVGLALLSPAAAEIPTYLNPINYDLSLHIIHPDSFTGEAIIEVKTADNIASGIYNLVLHGHNLNLSEVAVTYPSGKKIHVVPSTVKINKDEDTMSIPVTEVIKSSSQYTIRILYSGSIGTKAGLVATKLNGMPYFVTHLYPGFARYLYPCLDQPNMRATYSLNITTAYITSNKQPTIVSGLNMISQEAMDSKLRVSYNSYKKTLPPYGITFAIGQFQNNQIYYPSEMRQNIVSKSIIPALQAPTFKNLKSAANVPTVNLVIIPGLPAKSTFGYGFAAISQDVATETVSKTAYNTLKSNAIEIFSVILKTIFGVVISPSSWSDIWIPESLALYISHAALSEMDRWSDWKGMGMLDAQQAALEGSWSSNSWPVKPTSFASVGEVVKFLSDPAIYKGASILGMIESLSEDKNYTAFINFVTEKAHMSVSSDDLLDSYERNTHLNGSLPAKMSLKDVVSPWLKQTGYPAISVSRKSNNIAASQSMFGPNQNKDVSWIVPISSRTYENGSFVNSSMKWLNSDKNAEVQLATNLQQNDTVITNYQGSGLYRVHYEEHELLVAGEALKKNLATLSPVARTTFVSDGLAFAKIRGLRYSVVLKMLNYLDAERSLSPLITFSKGLRELWPILYFTELKTQFENYATNILRYSYNDERIGGLGLDSSSFVGGMIRKAVVSDMCDYDDLICYEDTNKAYKDYILANKESKIIGTDMIPVLYCNGLRELEDTTIIMTLLNKYSKTDPTDAKRNIFSYLACPRNNNTLNYYLNTVLLDGNNTLDILPEDMVIAFEEVASRPEQLNLLLTFLTDNYLNLSRKLEDEHKAEMVQVIGKTASTDQHQKMLQKLNYGKSSLVEKALNAALKSISERQTFLKNNYNEIKAGLYGNEPSPTPTPTPSQPPTNGTAGPPSTSPKPHNGAASHSGAVGLIAALFLALYASQH